MINERDQQNQADQEGRRTSAEDSTVNSPTVQPGGSSPPVDFISSRYRTKRPLHVGAQGVVYLALDETLKREVVVKTPNMTHPDARGRFLREMEMAAGLRRKGIVPIFDCGESDDGVLFSVMPYYPAGSLADRLEESELPPSKTVEVMIHICDALHYAHTEGNLLHRDLKPENILIDEDGLPCIADFGLAVSRNAQSAGQSGGTIAYMPPEQFQDIELDSRADIWSLGVILYQMLAGRLPFSSIDETFSKDPVPPRQINEDVPQELERICLKCLSKDLPGRYSTAADLAADLRAWQGSWQGPRTQSTWWKWAVSAGIPLLLVVILFAAFPFLREPSHLPPEPSRLPLETSPPLQVDVLASRVGTGLAVRDELIVRTGEEYRIRVESNRDVVVALLQLVADDAGKYTLFDMLPYEPGSSEGLKFDRILADHPKHFDYETTDPPGTEAVFVLIAENEVALEQKYEKLKSQIADIRLPKIGFPERVLRQVAQRGRAKRIRRDESADAHLQRLLEIDLDDTDKLLIIWNVPPAEDSNGGIPEQ